MKLTNDNGAHSFTEGATFETAENINEFLKEEKTMKPQFKREEIYLDLSKLSEEQQRKVIALLPYKKFHNQYQITKLHFILWFDKDNKWWIYGTEIKNKTELTYSQFLDMMGESEEKSKVIENSEKELINNDGTLYIGEGLENYYKDQLERTGKFKVVAIDATSEEVLKVENYTREDMEKAYRAGEKGATYYFKDTTVILPDTYDGVDG